MSRRWTDDADARMAEMQLLWESISSPKSPAPRSVPRRAARLTMIPVPKVNLESLERKSRSKEREQKRALDNEQNRRRIQEHHRNLKNMSSHRVEGHHHQHRQHQVQVNPAPVTPKFHEIRTPTSRTQDAGATKKSYEQQSIEFQMARRALRKSLNDSVIHDISIEFVLPKDRCDGDDGPDQTGSESDPVLTQFGEQHDLRPVKRLLEY